MQSSRLLKAIARYRLITVDAAHQLLAHEETRKEVERAVEVEKRHGNIAAHPLYGRTLYYTLTAKACRELSLPEKRSQPMGPQALVSNVAFLWYCAGKNAQRINRAWMEQDEQHRPLLKYGMSSDRYATSAADGFVLMVADCNATVRTLKRKIIKEWFKRKKHPEWAAVMEEGKFMIVVITASSEKAKRLRRFLRDSGVSFDIAVYPELGKLFGGDGR